MSWSRHGRPQGERGYHHGNLREALIRAAIELIAQKGPSGFTFADAARWVGVSSAAPYRHFRDRDDLMADLARRGFDQFADELERAWNGGAPEPLRALDNMGRAYLRFAQREPGYYGAMFEAGLAVDQNSALRLAADRAFGVLRNAADVVCALLPKPDRPPAMMVALHLWSLSHGIASLFGRGDAARRKLPMPPEELLEAAVLVYMRGLGFGETGAPREEK